MTIFSSVFLYYCVCSLEVTVTSLQPTRLCRIAVFSVKPTFLSLEDHLEGEHTNQRPSHPPQPGRGTLYTTTLIYLSLAVFLNISVGTGKG